MTDWKNRKTFDVRVLKLHLLYVSTSPPERTETERHNNELR